MESEPPYQYVRGNPIIWTDPSGSIPSINSASLDFIVSKLRGWNLRDNLYGLVGSETGTVGFGDYRVNIRVPGNTFISDINNSEFGSYANSNTETSIYHTVLKFQGITNIENLATNVLVRQAVSNNNNPLIDGPIGPPAPFADYLQLYISPNGYAFYTGDRAPITPIDGAEPATSGYDRKQFQNWIYYEYIDSVDVIAASNSDASRSGSWSRGWTGAANATDLLNGILQAGDIGLRKYQVLIQENNISGCADRRAVIQTYHLYTNRIGHQIRPAYLSVSSTGELRETPIIYPAPPSGPRFQQTGPCYGSSACYNTANYVQKGGSWLDYFTSTIPHQPTPPPGWISAGGMPIPSR